MSYSLNIINIHTLQNKLDEAYIKYDKLLEEFEQLKEENNVLSHENIVDYLDSKGIKLYEHQADSYNAIKEGNNIIITTPTASGKTLAFNLPVMETLKNDLNATALYIYPAKALSNDQLHVLENFEQDLNITTTTRTYDGDTDKALRYSIRQNSRIILTNPYQLPSNFLYGTPSYSKNPQKQS